MSSRIVGRLNVSKSILLLCDMQEKFAPTIRHFEPIIEASSRLAQLAKLARIPCLVTEHYPSGEFFNLSNLDLEI